MTPEERAVSGAADEADERTDHDTSTGPGIWHRHFINALREAGYELKKVPSGPGEGLLHSHLTIGYVKDCPACLQIPQPTVGERR